MRRPDALRSKKPLAWSTGTGVSVWKMLHACAAGQERVVRRLLKRDPALARCQHVYRTPLYFAVRENHASIAELLLERGADPLGLIVNDPLPTVARDRGYDALADWLDAWLAEKCNASPRGEPVAEALRQRDLPRAAALLDGDPSRMSAGDLRSNQPLHWAVMTRNLEAIDALLARGADLEAARHDGARPIQLVNGDYHYRGWRDVPAETTTTPAEVLGHLRQRGAYVDICTAAAIGDLGRVSELLDDDPSLANRLAEYTTYYLGSGAPLRNAAANGHIEIVRLLLARGANPNLREEGVAPRGHALYSAAANGHYEIAELLLEHGAFPNPEVESSADALSRAISNGDERMIELLCRHGAARNVELMAYDGDVRTAAAVFAADPRRADDPDALAAAAGEGREAFVRLMLRYKPKLARRVVFPPWSVGAKTRALNELLFARGMNASQPDWLGATPLHYLARSGNLEGAALFLDHGAELDACDDDLRSTPLGWAAKHGQAAMVEFLLSRGANAELPHDLPWAKPRAWATRRGHAEVLELLSR